MARTVRFGVSHAVGRTRRFVAVAALCLAWPGLAAGGRIATAQEGTAGQHDQVQDARIRENNAREGWQRVPDVLVALGVVPGARVADVGAGDGFFTVRLARAVGPTGRVIAVDVDDDALGRLRARVKEELLTNVEVVRGDAGDPHLPAASLDAVLVVNAYHEMEQFGTMLEHFKRALQPGGRLVLVEPLESNLRGQAREKQTASHSLDSGFAARELRSAGFDVTGLRDPFIRHGSMEIWLMVAESPGTATRTAAIGDAAGRGTPSPSHGPMDFGTDAERASPDLRITTTRLHALVDAGRVVVLDVRDADGYLAGHLAGAILMPLPDLADRLQELLSGKKAVVAYCT